MGKKVSDLRRKLKILAAYRPDYSAEAIAMRFDRAASTIWGWADGNRGNPNEVPEEHFSAFLGIVAEAFGGGMKTERAQALLLGPVLSFENALRGPQHYPLQALIESEAQNDQWSLIRGDGLSLIETATTVRESNDLTVIKLGEYFRLVLARDLRHFNHLALQSDSVLWGLPGSDLDPKNGHLLIPGYKANGNTETMKETAQIGTHRFIVFATRNPIPSELASPPVQGGALNPAVIPSLIDFYRDQSVRERKLFALSLRVERDQER